MFRKPYSQHRDFRHFDGYCATAQGWLDWFAVDLSARRASSCKVICALSILIISWVDAEWSPLSLLYIMHDASLGSPSFCIEIDLCIA